MKAVVLRNPGDLVVTDVPTPHPGPDEVLVRVTNSGICGTDLKIFTGGMPASYPVIMGHEISGEVSGARRVVCGSGTLVRDLCGVRGRAHQPLRRSRHHRA